MDKNMILAGIQLIIIVFVCAYLIPVEYYTNINCECESKNNKNYRDINFHDTIDDIKAQTGDEIDASKLTNSTTHIINKNGRRYKSTDFVPVYAESIYMSRLTDQTKVKKIDQKNPGFCYLHRHNPLKIHEKCRSLNGEICASTTCCILLKNGKCVGESEKDKVKNTDYYYRDGKCYGNCE